MSLNIIKKVNLQEREKAIFTRFSLTNLLKFFEHGCSCILHGIYIDAGCNCRKTVHDRKITCISFRKKKSARGILECEPGHGSLVILIFWPS